LAIPWSDTSGHSAYREWLEDLINGDHVSATGNPIPDAYLAALAVESGSEWIKTDGDYGRFPGLTWRRPFRTRADFVRSAPTNMTTTILKRFCIEVNGK
jgi:hypothetical protein